MCGMVGVGGVLVGWGGCIPLSGISVGWWHFDGVFEWYLNGSFSEFRWGSVWESRWGVAGPSGFGMVGGILFVPLEFRQFLVVSACGVVFHVSPMIS